MIEQNPQLKPILINLASHPICFEHDEDDEYDDNVFHQEMLRCFAEFEPIKFRLICQHPEILKSHETVVALLFYPENFVEFCVQGLFNHTVKQPFTFLPPLCVLSKSVLRSMFIHPKIADDQCNIKLNRWQILQALHTALNDETLPNPLRQYFDAKINIEARESRWQVLLNNSDLVYELNKQGQLLTYSTLSCPHAQEPEIYHRLYPHLPSDQRCAAYLQDARILEHHPMILNNPKWITLGVDNIAKSLFAQCSTHEDQENCQPILAKIAIQHVLSVLNIAIHDEPILLLLSSVAHYYADELAQRTNQFTPDDVHTFMTQERGLNLLANSLRKPLPQLLKNNPELRELNQLNRIVKAHQRISQQHIDVSQDRWIELIEDELKTTAAQARIGLRNNHHLKTPHPPFNVTSSGRALPSYKGMC